MEVDLYIRLVEESWDLFQKLYNRRAESPRLYRLCLMAERRYDLRVAQLQSMYEMVDHQEIDQPWGVPEGVWPE